MAGVLAERMVGRNLHKYQHLYKKKGPSWKENYYKRCVERIKSSREIEISRHRSLTCSPVLSPELKSTVRNVMKEEWRLVFGDEQDFPEFGTKDFEEAELMLEIEDRLKRAEEEMIFEEFEKVSLAEETEINSHLELSSILCPVCQIAHLTRSDSSIRCICGAEIRNDCLTLSELHTQLMDAVHLHNSVCELDLNFNSKSGQLLILCSNCNFKCTIT